MPHTAPAHAPVLTIDVEMVGTVPVVHCHGRLVLGATSVLYDGVRELIPHSKRIILDLTDLKHTDSMGLGTLARLYVSSRSSGCSLELMHLSKQIRHLLGVTGMLQVFTVIGESGGIRWM